MPIAEVVNVEVSHKTPWGDALMTYRKHPIER
jgi:hypothetical protein